MSYRLEQINELIKQETAKIIEKELGPDIGFLTITTVETSRDLKFADVWISVYKSSQNNWEEDLRKITPVVQKILNKRLKLKYVPKITFKIDNSCDYAFEIDKILNKVKNSKDE